MKRKRNWLNIQCGICVVRMCSAYVSCVSQKKISQFFNAISRHNFSNAIFHTQQNPQTKIIRDRPMAPPSHSKYSAPSVKGEKLAPVGWTRKWPVWVHANGRWHTIQLYNIQSLHFKSQAHTHARGRRQEILQEAGGRRQVAIVRFYIFSCKWEAVSWWVVFVCVCVVGVCGGVMQSGQHGRGQ